MVSARTRRRGAPSGRQNGRGLPTNKGDSIRFYCRAVGVFFDRGRVLLEKVETIDFWTLPGGQIELGEMSEDALRREMMEETGAEIIVERLLWVAEGVYRFENQPCHELAFYYLAGLPPGHPLAGRDEAFLGREGPEPLIFRWFALEELDGIDLRPSFLKKGLRGLPETIEHVVLALDGESPLVP